MHPLHLQPAHDLAMSFQRAGFTVHAVQEPRLERVAQNQNCSYLAVKAASAFMYKPTDKWRITEPSDLLDKDKSMMDSTGKSGVQHWNGCRDGARSRCGHSPRDGAIASPSGPRSSAPRRQPCKKDCARAGTECRARR